jgi:hypothetical protein
MSGSCPLSGLTINRQIFLHLIGEKNRCIEMPEIVGNPASRCSIVHWHADLKRSFGTSMHSRGRCQGHGAFCSARCGNESPDMPIPGYLARGGKNFRPELPYNYPIMRKFAGFEKRPRIHRNLLLVNYKRKQIWTEKFFL